MRWTCHTVYRFLDLKAMQKKLECFSSSVVFIISWDLHRLSFPGKFTKKARGSVCPGTTKAHFALGYDIFLSSTWGVSDPSAPF